jgi:hypothetical protein
MLASRIAVLLLTPSCLKRRHSLRSPFGPHFVRYSATLHSYSGNVERLGGLFLVGAGTALPLAGLPPRNY